MSTLHIDELNRLGEELAAQEDLLPDAICQDCLVQILTVAGHNMPETLKAATEHREIGPALMWGVAYGIRIGAYLDKTPNWN